MKRVKLIISYDGTNYSGWQIQNNAITIQSKIEDACKNLFSQEIKIVGASRTDAGVHALGQVAVFDIDTTIPSDRISYALNNSLPEDIVIQESVEVHKEFHPRYEAIKKTYEYNIVNRQFMLPQHRLYSWFVKKELNVDKMKEACKYFIGEHDFKSFCSVNTQVRSTIRTIYNLEIVKNNPYITIRIEGNGFLYNMVRIITGTLVDVGKGRIEPNLIERIIKDKDRSKAGITAPANGLILTKIEY